MAGPNDEWPILADPNPDDEEWPLEPNIDPAPPPNRANVSPVLVGVYRTRRRSTALFEHQGKDNGDHGERGVLEPRIFDPAHPNAHAARTRTVV